MFVRVSVVLKCRHEKIQVENLSLRITRLFGYGGLLRRIINVLSKSSD